MGVGEVDLQVQPFGQLLVAGHLTALVVDEGLAQAHRQGAQVPCEALQDRPGAAAMPRGAGAPRLARQGGLCRKAQEKGRDP